MDNAPAPDQLLAEQRAYYSALAPQYLDQLLDLPGGAELASALDAFRPAGNVLELACDAAPRPRLGHHRHAHRRAFLLGCRKPDLSARRRDNGV